MLSTKRDLIAAKRFLRLAISAGGPPPRIINVDGHPAYPRAVAGKTIRASVRSARVQAPRLALRSARRQPRAVVGMLDSDILSVPWS